MEERIREVRGKFHSGWLLARIESAPPVCLLRPQASQHCDMGVILDSSVLIAGERRKEIVREILKRVRTVHGEIDCALSVVTIVELTHGICRAKSDADRQRRRTSPVCWAS